MDPFLCTTHDDHPPAESQTIDLGLEAFNARSAPLHEVRPLACFARTGKEGPPIGGVLGRRWGACCELQQVWVTPEWRRRGVGTRLVHAFETHARQHGCTSFHLETFDFQAPDFYLRLGYRIEHERRGYPHGIVKYHLAKHDAPNGSVTLAPVP